MTTQDKLLTEANDQIFNLIKCLQEVRQRLTLLDFSQDPKKEIKEIIQLINKTRL